MGFSKILVPTDFSHDARAALEPALDFARRFGAELELLHVWSLPPLGIPEWAVLAAGASPMPVRDFIRNQATQQMALLLDELRRAGLRVEGQIEEGDAPRVILHRAALGQHDLIVMGTHGRSGVARVLVGSVTEQVIRHARCPVLAVRPRSVAAAHVQGAQS